MLSFDQQDYNMATHTGLIVDDLRYNTQHSYLVNGADSATVLYPEFHSVKSKYPNSKVLFTGSEFIVLDNLEDIYKCTEQRIPLKTTLKCNFSSLLGAVDSIQPRNLHLPHQLYYFLLFH